MVNFSGSRAGALAPPISPISVRGRSNLGTKKIFSEFGTAPWFPFSPIVSRQGVVETLEMLAKTTPLRTVITLYISFFSFTVVRHITSGGSKQWDPRGQHYWPTMGRGDGCSPSVTCLVPLGCHCLQQTGF